MASPSHAKTVLVTGANGYIGNAIAHAFVRAGWETYGLVRSSFHIPTLAAAEIIPLLGSPSDHSFLASLPQELHFDVIVSTTEDMANYTSHYNAVVSLLTILSKRNAENGKQKPLVLFTSGCKDYGMMDALADSHGLEPHTEDSPVNPPSLVATRAAYAPKIFEHAGLFDAAVLRPTNVYGYSSSYYAAFFELAEQAMGKGVWELRERKKTMLHALHVDDCSEAYVALAEAEREGVRGECFNISSWRYETLEEIVGALRKEYGIAEVKWGAVPEGRADEDFGRMVLGFSQWTGSQKLRQLTGWKDRRQLFSEGLGQYRVAFEATAKKA